MAALKSQFKSAHIDFTDGLTVEFDDWWFNVRTAQTEPVVRLCVGAVDSDLLGKRKIEIEQLIQNAIRAPAAR
jgi:phosphomannomutase